MTFQSILDFLYDTGAMHQNRRDMDCHPNWSREIVQTSASLLVLTLSYSQYSSIVPVAASPASVHLKIEAEWMRSRSAASLQQVSLAPLERGVNN